jgi:cAMP-dependent protein kinase regulator
MFGALDEKELIIVIDAMKELPVSNGTVIIKEGDDGEELYVVDKGSFACTKVFVSLLMPERRRCPHFP